jgi:DNA-binding GntR family transcriptional regulator
MIDEDDPRPPWVQLADSLRERIRTGDLNGRMPSERTIHEETGLAPVTIRKAIRKLRDEGLVVTVSGRGTFVKRDAGEPTG